MGQVGETAGRADIVFVKLVGKQYVQREDSVVVLRLGSIHYAHYGNLSPTPEMLCIAPKGQRSDIYAPQHLKHDIRYIYSSTIL